MNRRSLLGSIGALFVSLSGCTGLLTTEQSSLGEVTVGNNDSEPHVVTVAVEHDDKMTHMSSHQLDSFDESTQTADSESVQREWPEASGDIIVYAQADNDGLEKLALSNLPNDSCYEITVLIDTDGRTNVLYSAGCLDE